MSTSPDLLARALDDAIGDGPPLPPLESHLDAGRRALRRRRRAASAAGVGAAAVVLAATYAVVGSTTSSGPVVPTAPVPAPAAAPSPAPSDGAVVTAAPRGPVRLTDGELLVRLDVRTVRTVEDPLGRAPEGRSVGVVLRYRDGRAHYWLLDEPLRGEGTVSASEAAAGVEGSFADWLAEQAGALRSLPRGPR